MAKDDKPSLYVVTESFIVEIDGAPVAYRAGEAVEADDPQVKRVPDFFGPFVFPHPVKRALAKPEVRS